MTQTGRTPTPWKYEKYPRPYSRLIHARLIHVEDDGYELVFLEGLDPEDAKFIVEACNAHESLTVQRDALRKHAKLAIEWGAVQNPPVGFNGLKEAIALGEKEEQE